MSQIFDAEHGIPTLVATLCVLITLQILGKLGQFLYGLLKKKNEVSDQSINDLTKSLNANTAAMNQLEARIKMAEELIGAIPKIKKDLRRYYAGLREVAGEDWVRIRDVIMKDLEDT